MPDERLIMGFERGEVASKMGSSWTGIEETEDGFDFHAWFEEGIGNAAWTWRCRTGDSTEGETALVGRIGPVTPPTTFGTTRYLSRHYPAIWVRGKDWKGGEAHRILETFQWLAYSDSGLTDWRGFERLRVDVKAKNSVARLWLAIEDDEIEPPVVASFRVPKGKWVTVQLDLDRAEYERGLDLSDIVNFWLLGASKEPTEVLVDNVRLVKAGAAADLRIIRDTRSFDMVRPKRRKRAKVPPVPRGTRPVRGDVASVLPREVCEGSVVPFGFIGAFDDDRIILGRTIHGEDLDRRPEVSKSRKLAPVVEQTSDGGSKWRKLPDPVWRNLDHGSARGCVISPRGEALVLSSGPGCAGLGRATPRQHLTKYTFAGSGWAPRFPASIVDSDIRHCGSNFSCVRLPSGKNRGVIWGAWGSVDRRRSLDVHAAFSDDDGVTWWPWGATGRVPGSREGGFSANTYSYQTPRIAPLGDGIAVFWQDSRGLLWTAYDGERWRKLKAVDLSATAPLAVSANEPFRVPGSAVAVGDQVFVTAWRIPGVLRLSHGRWSAELTGIDDGGVLSAAGDRLVLVTSGRVEQPPPEKRVQINRPARILAYVRSPDGVWSEPVDLAEGEVYLHEYRQTPAVVVPAYSPPDFVPVAWSDGERVWMRSVVLEGDGV